MRRVAVQNASHFYNSARELDVFTENLCAIGRGENGFAHIQANLAPVDIECGDNFNVTRAVTADLPVHQPDASAVDGRTVVKIDSLDKRAGAVSDTDNGDSYFSHF